MESLRRDEWPILVVGRDTETSNQRVNEEFFAVLGEALDRDGRFGMIVDKTSVDPGDVRRSEAELRGIRWLSPDPPAAVGSVSVA